MSAEGIPPDPASCKQLVAGVGRGGSGTGRTFLAAIKQALSLGLSCL